MALEQAAATYFEVNETDVLIDAKSVGLTIRSVKQGRPGGSSYHDLLRASFGGSASIFKRAILHDLNFSVHRGDRVGLIGPNGAGKSTLLFVLNGALQHNSGQLEINGSTHALMNIRLGMKPRATGIENIYLNGYRYGLNSDQVKALVEDILDFSELGNRIHEPIYTYSAGMQLRLAFGISTSIKPDIVLMDEWVGAGDQAFQQKASSRLNALLAQSRALIIASHNEKLIRGMCNKVLYLENGTVRFFGDVDEGYKIFASASNRQG